jgi:hypothetical protein
MIPKAQYALIRSEIEMPLMRWFTVITIPRWSVPKYFGWASASIVVGDAKFTLVHRPTRNCLRWASENIHPVHQLRHNEMKYK